MILINYKFLNYMIMIYLNVHEMNLISRYFLNLYYNKIFKLYLYYYDKHTLLS